MILNRDLQDKVNAVAADMAVKNYGLPCDDFKECWDACAKYPSNEKKQTIGHFLDSSRCCANCDKKCDVYSYFSQFQDGAEWMLEQVSGYLSERFLLEHIGIRL